MKTALVLFALTLVTSPSFAAIQEYKIVPRSASDTGIKFDIPYTLGVHHGFSSQVTGEISVDSDPISLHDVALTIPITAMTTGDHLRDCHMREALGIDYSHSQFPKHHVCVNDQTPASGPDSIAFPTIELTLLTVAPTQGTPGAATATARLTIHGISHELTIPLQISTVGNGLHVSSNFNVSLKDFGITVIPVLFVTVGDTATITIDLALEPK